jgi:hypothetical protein
MSHDQRMAALSKYIPEGEWNFVEGLIKEHVAAALAEAQAEVDACNDEIKELEAKLATMTSEATYAARELLDQSDAMDNFIAALRSCIDTAKSGRSQS